MSSLPSDLTVAERDARRAIVIVCDGLGAEYLGPYGNTWIETPSFNRLAAESFLAEHAICDSPTQDGFYRSIWCGHPATYSGPARPTLMAACRQAGLSTRLISDVADLARHPLAETFDQSELVAVEQTTDQAAAAPAETGMGQLVAATLASLEADGPNLLWIHARAMEGPWDAPLPFREQFADEDDPLPPPTTQPPTGPLPVDLDPDERLGWVWAYAGQIAMLDSCLEPIFEVCDRTGPPTLLVMVGSRGYSLGEHGHWGASARQVHSERVHVPLLMSCHRDDTLARIRCQQLVQTRHLYHTLVDWFQLGDRLPEQSLLALAERDLTLRCANWPNLACSRAGNEWLLRTPTWSTTFRGEPGEKVSSDHQLYLKPDDVWEVNDVASLRPDVVGELQRLWQQLTAMTDDDVTALLPLHELLTTRPQ